MENYHLTQAEEVGLRSFHSDEADSSVVHSQGAQLEPERSVSVEDSKQVAASTAEPVDELAAVVE